MSSKTTIPDGFVTIVKDLLSDILNTFPEYCGASFNSDLKKLLVSPIEECTDEINNIYQHCIIALPERFFDILYKNSDMFTNSDINTDFLPGINFTILWNSEGISGTIHDTIWRYLQLLVFTLVGNMGNGESFGDAAKLFEAINEDDLKQKLEETMGQMKDMFENMDEDKSNINLDDLGKYTNHTFCESRDKKSNLTFLNLKQQIELIKECKVVDLSSKNEKLVTIKELI